MRDFKIFIDLDEVTYDLSSEIIRIVNKEYNKNFKKSDNKSYWWGCLGLPRYYFESLLNRSGTFLNGQPIPKAIESINKLKDLGFEIHILTTPQHNANCYFEKVRWIKKYLPWINLDTNFHTTGNKGLMAKADRILVDDGIHNLESWGLNKGVAIAFGNYGWNEKWTGLKVSNWNETVDLILKMEGVNEDKPKGIDVDRLRMYMECEHNE